MKLLPGYTTLLPFSVLGLGQSQVFIQTEERSPSEQPCGEGPGGPGGQEAGHEPAVCACSPEGQLCAGLHQNGGGQQGEGGDCAPLLSSWEAPSAVLRPGLGATAQEGRGALGGGPEEGH